MIKLGPGIQYAAAPRTGTTWMQVAAFRMGWGETHKVGIHTPFNSGGGEVLRVTTVRHPCDWLASYWTNIHPGQIHELVIDHLARLPGDTFDEFIRAYLRKYPGGVGRVFDGYGGDSVIRLEDQPGAFMDLALAAGCSYRQVKRCRSITPRNRSSRDIPLWHPSLWDRVCDAEWRIMDRYGYTTDYRDPG